MAFFNSTVDPKSLLVVVARHGTTLLNASGCFRGSANPGLDAEGIRDAKNLARLIAPFKVSRILSSDRLRATQTAEIVGARMGQSVHVNENLRALNVGKFSGQQRTPANLQELKGYLEDRDNPIPGGESLSHFKARIRICLAEAADLAVQAGSPVLVIAHSSIVHELGSYIHGDHNAVLVKPGGIAAMYLSDSGKPSAAAVYRMDHERIRRARAESISEFCRPGAMAFNSPFPQQGA